MSARSQGAFRHVALVPTLTLVLLPKCPLCLATYFGIWGSFGAGSWLRSAWGLPLAAVLLGLALGALALRALRAGDFRSLLVGLVGAAALLMGKYVLDTALLLYAGAALLALASFGKVRGRRPRRAGLIADGPP